MSKVTPSMGIELFEVMRGHHSLSELVAQTSQQRVGMQWVARMSLAGHFPSSLQEHLIIAHPIVLVSTLLTDIVVAKRKSRRRMGVGDRLSLARPLAQAHRSW
jgi:hypothetical protein